LLIDVGFSRSLTINEIKHIIRFKKKKLKAFYSKLIVLHLMFDLC